MKSKSFYGKKKLVEAEGEEEDEDEEDSLVFAVKIFDGEFGAKVSKKNICIVEIVPDAKEIGGAEEE